MAVTELLFPSYKQDAESQSQLRDKAAEIFSHFSGVEGLHSIFRGKVVADDGIPVDPSSSPRAVLVLEWDQPSSFHAFFPTSSGFQEFLKLVKPLMAAPTRPELFEATSLSAPCASSNVTQIIKVVQGEDTVKVWDQIQGAISESKIATPFFFNASGIEDQQGIFVGMIGWQGLQDYDTSRTDKTVDGLLRELATGGKICDIAVQMSPVNI